MPDQTVTDEPIQEVIARVLNECSIHEVESPLTPFGEDVVRITETLTAALAEGERLRRIAMWADVQWGTAEDADYNEPAILSHLIDALEAAGYSGNTTYAAALDGAEGQE